MMTGPSLWVIGDVFTPTMQPVRRCVEDLVERGAVARFTDRVSDVPRREEGEPWFPDLVVVCQHWPDEYSERDVRGLFEASPLARVLCCYGPWCASDGRRRDIWPPVVRVPVRQVSRRIAGELAVWAGTRPALPLTASRDEMLLLGLDFVDADAPDWA